MINKESIFTIETIKEAVSIQQNNPNSEQGNQALQYLQNFYNCSSCFNLSLQLYSRNNPDELRHFALYALNQFLKKNWSKIINSNEETLKKIVNELLTEGTKGVIEEQLYIKEKVAEIITTILLNWYPKEWPSLFNQIMKSANNSEKSLELVLKILRNVRCETDINSSHLSLTKQENFKKSMRHYNDEIYNLIEATLSICVECVDPKTSKSETEKRVASSLMMAALDSLTNNIQFPMQGLFRNNLVDLLCSLTSQHNFALKSVECMILITNKKSNVPQTITVQQYRNKFYLIWKTVVDMLNEILKPNIDPNFKEQLFNELVDVSSFLLKNHKSITYINTEKNLKVNFIRLLTQVFNVEKDKPLDQLLELWRTLFEVKFFDGMTDCKALYKGLFIAVLDHLDKDPSDFIGVDLEEEVKNNLLRASLLLLRLIMINDRELFLEMCVLKLQSLISNDMNNPNESLQHRKFDNYFKVLRLAFSNDCLSYKIFKRKEKSELVVACENLLKMVLEAPRQVIFTDYVLNSLVRFSTLFNTNIQALKAALDYIFKVFKNFELNMKSTEEVSRSHKILTVRRSAVYTLIKLSRGCKSHLVPLYNELEQCCADILSNSSGEEDLSGLLEFLLTLSEDESLRERRNEMLAQTIDGAVQKLTSPETTRFFTAQGLLELMKPSDKMKSSRQIMRVALNTVNSLLRAVTRSPVSYNSENRHSVVLFFLNSFRNDEVWERVRPAVQTIPPLCHALNQLHDEKIKQLQPPLPDDIQVLLFYPERIKEWERRIKPNPERLMHFCRCNNWLNDIRDMSYSLLSLSCNLSDTFFTLNPKILLETVFIDMPTQDGRNIKAMTEKLISPFTIRCSAVVPQYLDSFLEPILSYYFTEVNNILRKKWDKMLELENHEQKVAESDINAEISAQNHLRQLTRCISRLFISFTYDFEIKSPFDPPKWKAKKYDEFKLNRILYQFLFNTASIRQPLIDLLLFFVKCKDAVSRDNIYRFLLQLVTTMTSKNIVKSLIPLMVSGMESLSNLEVNNEMIDFVSKLLYTLTQMDQKYYNEILLNLTVEESRSDLQFLLDAFQSRDSSLRRKKTKLFLIKLASRKERVRFFSKDSVIALNNAIRSTPTKTYSPNKYPTTQPVLRGLFDEGGMI